MFEFDKCEIPDPTGKIYLDLDELKAAFAAGVAPFTDTVCDEFARWMRHASARSDVATLGLFSNSRRFQISFVWLTSGSNRVAKWGKIGIEISGDLSSELGRTYVGLVDQANREINGRSALDMK